MAKIDQTNIALPFRLLLGVPVPWVYILGYLIGVALEWKFPLNVLPLSSLTGIQIAGGSLFGAGAVVAGWSLYRFYRASTTTVPGQVSNELVIDGFYKFTRNPMYVGLALAYLGEAGLLLQVWPVAVLPFVLAYVNWVVIPLEESRLRANFGPAYTEYCSKVRRWG